MSNEATTQTNGTNGGFRDVPANISEYRKFVAEGGIEHNAKLSGRADAEKAAAAAGLALANGEGDKPHRNNARYIAQRKLTKLHREIGARDQRIADLEKQVGARSNGAPHEAKPDAVETRAAAAKPGATEEEKKTPARPEQKNFKTWDEYNEALLDWKLAEDKRKTTAAQEEERRASEYQIPAEHEAAHKKRVDEAIARYPDWYDALKGLDDSSFTRPMADFICESEKGPDITHYLAKHRKELARIRELSPLKQIAALGRLEDRLSEETDDEDKDKTEDDGEDEDTAKTAKPAKSAKAGGAADDDEDEEEETDEQEEDEKPAPRRAAAAHSKAPPPKKPLAGRGGATDAMPDPNDFPAYEKWSKRQAAKAKANR